MDDPLDMTPQLALLALLLPVTLGGFAIAGMRGCLSRGILANAPSRNIHFQSSDLLITAFLKLAGMIFAGIVVVPFVNEEVNRTAVLTLLTQLLSVVLPVTYIFYRVIGQEKAVDAFGLGKGSWRHLRAGLLGTMLALPVVMTISTLGSIGLLLSGVKPPEVGHSLLNMLSDPGVTYAGVMIALSAVLIAPAAEELIYRGLIQTFLLRRLGPSRRWLVIAIASMIFALVHLGSVPWIMLPSLFALGMILGWLYEVTGSLTPSIIVHALFNGANLLLAVVVLN
jgi:membrane protease YdiL (CAAX protease family)